MSRDAQVQQWEKHLAKIIEQANKNISSSRSHVIDRTLKQDVPAIPLQTENSGFIPNNQAGYHQLQAQQIIQGTSMGLVNRPVQKQVEEDLSDRIQLAAKRTVEKAISDKMHSTHLRIDRLCDKIDTLSEDGVKIHKEYGLLARSIATQERLTKRLKQESESQKLLVTKLGEAMANDVGWKESTNMDLKIIKDQLRQDSATCVTTTDMKNALEAITSKTMLAMERSTMSAKLAFESDIALLKQEMQRLKEENEKLKTDLSAVHETSRILVSKLEHGNIKAIVSNAVEGQLEKIESKVLNSVISSISRKDLSLKEMTDASVIETIKDVLGRELIHGGGDFHTIIGSVIVKLFSKDKEILDLISSCRVPSWDEDTVKVLIESSLQSKDKVMYSRLETLEKQVEEVVSNAGYDSSTNIALPPVADIETLLSSIEKTVITQVRDVEMDLKAYCDKSISSFTSNIASISKELESTVQLVKGSSNKLEYLDGTVHDLKEMIEGPEVLERLLKCENVLNKSENSWKAFVDGTQNEVKCLSRQLNELESKDFNRLNYDVSSIRSTMELLQSSKNYSVEDLASCMGKINMLESKFRHEIHSLRGEFVDLQGNVYDQNSASAERIELLIKQVHNDVAKIATHPMKLDAVDKSVPEFVTCDSNTHDDIKEDLEHLYKIVDDLNKRFHSVEYLPEQLDNLERHLSSQINQSEKLANDLITIKNRLQESPRAPEQRNIIFDDGLRMDMSAACSPYNFDTPGKEDAKYDVFGSNKTKSEQCESAEISKTTHSKDLKPVHCANNSELGEQLDHIENIERCASHPSMPHDESENTSEEEEAVHENQDCETEAVKIDDSYHKEQMFESHSMNKEYESTIYSCFNQMLAQRTYDITESIEGCILSADEIERVSSLMDGDMDDTTISSSSNESDVSYESDFEEL